MGRDWFGMARRALRKPPSVVVKRLWAESVAEIDRYRAPRAAKALTEQKLLQYLGFGDLNALWEGLLLRPYPAYCRTGEFTLSDAFSQEEIAPILARAARASKGTVELLGSGTLELGPSVDWVKDYKTGRRWPNAYFRSIEYSNLDEPSDVKFPWELSRMQWMIPLGQAYVLTGKEEYAQAAREYIDSWIHQNPYASSVNWACTMEVALRVVTWTWFHHVFGTSAAWNEAGFRFRFLKALYLHGLFTERNLEESDVNGNHYTADAAGLVFAGLFFGQGRDAGRWLAKGWEILTREIEKQVSADGVDYEGSVAYHRLVTELFLWPALYRRCLGLEISGRYKEKLIAMAVFVAAYSRPDGSSPLLGDADDGRVLPFGGQAMNDHRYLCAAVAHVFGGHCGNYARAAVADELLWTFGPNSLASTSDQTNPDSVLSSAAFPQGGYYIMRNVCDHVFIDCAPIGLAGRGGHGHNDCLSFELMLSGTPLISDCGAYLYTADYRERNNFRSTGYHNTPRIDGKEINRFIREDYLWNLHNDAHPVHHLWHTNAQYSLFVGSHDGYRRLKEPVVPVRTFMLDHERHAFVIQDRIEGGGRHAIDIPMHFAEGIELIELGEERILLRTESQQFTLIWESESGCTCDLEQARISPSYGVVVPSKRLVWRADGGLPFTLSMVIVPGQGRDSRELKRYLDRLGERIDSAKTASVGTGSA